MRPKIFVISTRPLRAGPLRGNPLLMARDAHVENLYTVHACRSGYVPSIADPPPSTAIQYPGYRRRTADFPEHSWWRRHPRTPGQRGCLHHISSSEGKSDGLEALQGLDSGGGGTRIVSVGSRRSVTHERGVKHVSYTLLARSEDFKSRAVDGLADRLQQSRTARAEVLIIGQRYVRR